MSTIFARTSKPARRSTRLGTVRRVTQGRQGSSQDSTGSWSKK